MSLQLKALSNLASSNPILPNPTIPIFDSFKFLPYIYNHFPSEKFFFDTCIFLKRYIIKPITYSATA